MAARLLALHPDVTLPAPRRLPFQDGDDWHRFLAGLRAAGLPA